MEPNLSFTAGVLLLAVVRVLAASDTAGPVDARPVKQQLVGSGRWQSQRNGNDSNWHLAKNWVISSSGH